MAITVKYHEKNQAVFFALQSGSGDTNKVATSSLTPTTAIAATGVTSDATRETGALTFLGDSLSRDEFTYQKDKYIDLGIETYQEVLFDLTSPIAPDTYAIWKIFQTCGGNVVVNSDNTVYAGNHLDSPDYGTADVRYSTPDDPDGDKLFKFWDLRGTVDVDASIGEPPKLKFSLKGNADDPVQAPKQSADTGFQTTRVAPSIQSSTIRKAQIALLDDTFTNAVGTVLSAASLVSTGRVIVTFTANHNLNVGEIIAINVSGASVSAFNGSYIAMVESNTTISYFVKGLTTAHTGVTISSCKKGDTPTYNFCFSTLSAPNFWGFDLTRYQTGCDFGFTKGAVPTDVTAGMLAAPAAKLVVTSITISGATLATVVTAVPHGMSTGNKVTIAGAGGVDALKINITATVTVTNTTTFTYVVATSTNGAVSAASGTIITAINNSNTSFDPDLFVTRFFGLYLSFGESNAAGKRVGYLWNKAQMSNTKEGKVSTYFGREATFRNTGQSFMLWS
jgi:hypothetical protein